MSSDFDTALKEFLESRTSLTALVGNRIYPMTLPEKFTLPALTYQRISSPEDHLIGTRYPRYQISSWANTHKMARAVAEQVKSVLQRYKGMMGSFRVKQIVYENAPDMYYREADIYHVPTDVQIIYQEDWK